VSLEAQFWPRSLIAIRVQARLHTQGEVAASLLLDELAATEGWIQVVALVCKMHPLSLIAEGFTRGWNSHIPQGMS